MGSDLVSKDECNSLSKGKKPAYCASGLASEILGCDEAEENEEVKRRHCLS